MVGEISLRGSPTRLSCPIKLRFLWCYHKAGVLHPESRHPRSSGARSKLVSMVEGVESIVRVMPKSDDALANGTRELVALSKNGVSAVTR